MHAYLQSIGMKMQWQLLTLSCHSQNPEYDLIVFIQVIFEMQARCSEVW